MVYQTLIVEQRYFEIVSVLSLHRTNFLKPQSAISHIFFLAYLKSYEYVKKYDAVNIKIYCKVCIKCSSVFKITEVLVE